MAPAQRSMPGDLVERYEAGESARQLAKSIGCAVSSVLRHLHKRGAAVRSRGGQRKERAA